MEPTKIYRIENEISKHGMWYREDGTYDPFIFKLTEGISAGLPMGFDKRYSEGGEWISAALNVEQMQYWFSRRDAIELFQAGYKLYEFEAAQYIKEEHQVLFTREGVKSKIEIPLSTIWTDIGKDIKEQIIIKNN